MFMEPGDILELRALGGVRSPGSRPATVSGYFDDPAKLARAAAELDGCCAGVYLTINPVKEDLLARACNRVVWWPKATTGDADITRRRWLLVDIDPKRASGVSATSQEKAEAAKVANRVVKALGAEYGWPAPVMADSGNGLHLLYRVDLPNDDEARDLLQRVLLGLADKYSTEGADVDKTPFNAARITKAYGVMSKKGDPVPKRPHRRSKIMGTPDDVSVVTREQLEAVAALAPAEPPRRTPPPRSRTTRSTTSGEFDVETWLRDHSLSVSHTTHKNGMDIFVLDECPYDPGHGDDARVIRQPSGALSFRCFHDSCSGYTWQDLRARYEPEYLERLEVRGAMDVQRVAPPIPGARIATRSGLPPWSAVAEAVAIMQVEERPPAIPSPDPHEGRDRHGVIPLPPIPDAPGAPLIDPRDKLAICQRFRETFGHMVYRYRGAAHRYDPGTGLYEEMSEEEFKAFVLEWLYECDEEKRVKGECLLAPFRPGIGYVEKFTKKGGLLWAYVTDLDPEEYRYAAWLPGMMPPGATDDLLPVANYIIDIGCLELGKGAPPVYRYDGRVFARRKADIDYRAPDPGDPGPETWLRMLETSMSMRTVPLGDDGEPIDYARARDIARGYTVYSDEDTISVFQSMMGYLLTRESRWHHILYMVGAPRSGKSTILHVLDMIFPPGSTEATSSERFGGRFGLDNLYDARVIEFNEERGNEDIRSMKRLVGQLLAVSGQDRVNYEDKGCRSESTRIPGKIILTSNEELNLVDPSGAIVERLYMFPYRHNFQRLGAADPYLEDKLRKEAPGILNWFLDGLALFRGWHGFPPRSRAMTEMLSIYSKSTNTIEQWMDECCQLEPGHKCSSDDMYLSYTGWAREKGYHPGSKRTFLAHFRSATHHVPVEMQSVRISGAVVYGCVGMGILEMY